MPGSLKLFRLFGINVYLHWTWLLGAVFIIGRNRVLDGNAGAPHSLAFFVVLYFCLFFIVLIHEFGHALACKSVGGRADRILLQPLGGIAFVDPPQRAGAMLWSIVAGPLVNVILLPITIIPAVFLHNLGAHGIGYEFVFYLAILNAGLLIFNLLPFYPLDGGQILRSLLWFVAGRGLSLIIAAAIGIAGALLLALWAFAAVDPILGLIVLFMAFQSYTAIRVGMAMLRLEHSPRNTFVRCPLCREHPPLAPIWRCAACGRAFDTFHTAGRCPQCGGAFETTTCPFCNQSSLHNLWYASTEIPVTPADPSPYKAY
jgi:Zn-dependent protease